MSYEHLHALSQFRPARGPAISGTPKERVNWVIDRDRVTRNTARTLFLKGYTWGEAVVRALGHECKLDWRISGVDPVTSSLSLVGPKQQGSSDESRDVGGGGGLSSSKAVIKAVAKRKAKQDEAPPSSFSERFAARASRACPSFNSKKGCVKIPKHCPQEKPHMCGACGKFGHDKGSPKCPLAA